MAEPFWTNRADGWQAEQGREEREDIVDASCAEPSEARLRAADACVVSLIFVQARQGSEGACELWSRNLLSRSVTR